MITKSIRNKTPQIGRLSFIAEDAVIIGDVTIGDSCSIWYHTVLRGDVAPIVIGRESNIQDGTVIHGTYQKCGVQIEDRVTVGHSCLLHGCVLRSGSLIGMGCIVMDEAIIGRDCLVGAGSLVVQRSKFEDGWLIMGRPAKAVRPLTETEKKSLQDSADHYLLYKSWYE